MSLFGKKKSNARMIGVLDIESGSVGAGLISLVPGERPHLLKQWREQLPTRGAPVAAMLLSQIEREIERSLIGLSEAATTHASEIGTGGIGIERAALFLHAPWASVSLEDNRATAQAHDATLEQLRAATGVIRDVPVTFHSFSTTATPLVHGLFDTPQDALVVSINSEVSELVWLRQGKVVGHATVPVGLNTLLRTLESHGQLSRAQALSVLSLSRTHQNHMWAEPLSFGAGEISRQLAQSVEELLPESKDAQHIFVLAPGKSADVFARTLTENSSFKELFAPGSTIRAVLPRHGLPHISGAHVDPDMQLLLESLFVDTRFGK